MKLSSLLDDGTGAQSVMRFVFLFVTVLTVTAVLAVWVVLCLKRGDFVNVPPDVLKLLGVLIGSVTTGKVLQSFSENFSGPVVQPVPSPAKEGAAETFPPVRVYPQAPVPPVVPDAP